MLRIDVNGVSGSRHYRIPASNPYVGKAGRDEIWARGLRNPWRFSFDRIDRRPSGSATSARAATRRSTARRQTRGVRPRRQLRLARDGGQALLRPDARVHARPAKTPPVAEYRHASGACAVTGGYAYHGSASPALLTRYVFGDFCNGPI